MLPGVSAPVGGDNDLALAESETLRGPFAGWRFRRTVPPLDLAEVRHVAQEVRRTLKGTGATRAETSGDDGHDWVSYRFEGLWLRLLFQSYSNARDHLVVNTVVIAGGFATSGLAVTATKGGAHTSASTTTAWVVFAIGLAVALAGGVSQLYRPGHRATGRSELAARLRDEGWALIDGHGDYAGKQGGDLFEVFDTRVAEVRRAAAELSKLADEQGTGRRRQSAVTRRR